MREGRLWITYAMIAASALAHATVSSASVIGVGAAAFGAGSTLTTFTGLATGTEVNNLSVDGLLFSYSLGSGQLIIDGGPGITNNVSPQNVVSTGNASGLLNIILSSDTDTFGYGFAILSQANIANATTIVLFHGVTNVGSLSYNAAPDPVFSGGFAGIQSTAPFNRVQIAFDGAAASAFALDNVRTATSAAAVPEPASFVLCGAGGLGLIAMLRNRRKRMQAQA